MAGKRRGYGEGTVFQRCEARYGCPAPVAGPPDPETGKATRVRPPHNCTARYYGLLEAGWTREGNRRRVSVSAKTHAEAVRKLRKKRRELEDFGDSGWNARTTVKQWVDTYLELRSQPPKPLSPNGLKAAGQPLYRWVVPTIGHRRVVDLTPGDIRKVAKAQFDATSIRGGQLSLSTVDATQRALMTCLRRARADGAAIPEQVFLVEKPGMGKSDRRPLTLEHTLRCLAVASELPHGVRWALTLLYGARQGEMLGLVEADPITGERLVDFDAGIIKLAWQLQELDYLDTRDKARGFKIPYGYEAVHLAKRFHLTRPKTEAGARELPIIEPIEVALRNWLEIRPDNPWGLVFPTVDGKPCKDDADRKEWHAIQYTASVAAVEPGEYAEPLDLDPVFHPSGQRYYHVHECRNLAATELGEVGASDAVIMGLLGHTKVETSRRYQLGQLEAKREAALAVAERIGLITPQR